MGPLTASRGNDIVINELKAAAITALSSLRGYLATGTNARSESPTVIPRASKRRVGDIHTEEQRS